MSGTRAMRISRSCFIEPLNSLSATSPALARDCSCRCARRSRPPGRRLERAGAPERAAVMRKATPRTLRHTWATLAAQAGVPLWEIAGGLGDTLATVMKNYAHHAPDHLRKAINFRRPEPD